MKKIWISLIVLLLIAACSSDKKDKSSTEQSPTTERSDSLVTYKFKVDGLKDTVISDSIWRIIFQVEGIDKLVLSRDDSVAVFTVNPELVSNELLRSEIAKRGGTVLN